jgi:hypothetical protein
MMKNTTNNLVLSELIEVQQVADDVSGDDEGVLSPCLVPDHQTSWQSRHNTFTSQAPPPAQPEKPKKWKKPKGMPKRPLSAYNLFFKSERQIIILSSSTTKSPSTTPTRKSRGKPPGVGFAGMARTIAARWKIITTSEKSIFEGQARIEKARYLKEMAAWRMKEAAKRVALNDAAALRKKQQQDEATQEAYTTWLSEPALHEEDQGVSHFEPIPMSSSPIGLASTLTLDHFLSPSNAATKKMFPAGSPNTIAAEDDLFIFMNLMEDSSSDR